MKPQSAVAWLANLFLAMTVASGCTAAGEGRPAAAQPPPPGLFGEAVLLGYLGNRDIKEASGMAASRRRPDMLWIVNDGGDDPVLYAVNTKGAHLGRVRIRNAHNVDWEDLAAFRLDSAATLLIADFGDNHARREENLLYFVREPDIAGQPNPFEISVAWHRRVRFVYEDGPRDCEAVAVDPDHNQILLLTKRTDPPVLYSLPLKMQEQPPVMIARRMGEVNSLATSTATSQADGSRFKEIRPQPTAMDFSPARSEIAILTYGNAYLYHRRAHLDWPEAFRTPPETIKIPALRQAEALCFGVNGQSLFVTSEQLPAPLYRLDRRNRLQQGTSS